MRSHKLKFLLLFCIFCFVCFTWIKNNRPKIPFKDLEIIKKYKLQTKRESGIREEKWYDKYYNTLNYILLWPDDKFLPFSRVSDVQKDFIKLRCPIINCLFTTNRFQLNDIIDFDVIGFMGKELDKENLPPKRALKQKYIFFNMESSPNYPVEDEFFDDFFNGTATYRLDSDIPLPHILIRDSDGYEVGPKIDMDWAPEDDVDKTIVTNKILKSKNQAAAIVNSNCESLSSREELIAELQKALKPFNYTVDVYGTCGLLDCSGNVTKCNEMLGEKYYFYLAYENSLDNDYVTKQLLRPLQNYMVPIVYGGADYSRFLPPGSYINAMGLTTGRLAKTMVDIMASPKKYLQFFWWKKYYTYHDPTANENICRICTEITYKEKWQRKKKKKKFRKWWNINYNEIRLSD